MNPRLPFLILAAWAIVAPVPAGAQASLGAPWDSVARVLRAPGTLTGGYYYRYGMPRRDLTVRVGDVTVAPAIALGSWAGFSGPGNDATMMGDLVVTGAELRPVLAEMARQRVSVSAVHNHLVGEQPTITYVHFHDQGQAVNMATRLSRVVARTATPLPVAQASPQRSRWTRSWCSVHWGARAARRGASRSFRSVWSANA